MEEKNVYAVAQEILDENPLFDSNWINLIPGDIGLMSADKESSSESVLQIAGLRGDILKKMESLEIPSTEHITVRTQLRFLQVLTRILQLGPDKKS